MGDLFEFLGAVLFCYNGLFCLTTIGIVILLAAIPRTATSWENIKPRDVFIARFGIFLVGLSVLWMILSFNSLSSVFEINYLEFFGPTFLGLLVVACGTVGIIRSGGPHKEGIACGLITILMSLAWIYFVFFMLKEIASSD